MSSITFATAPVAAPRTRLRITVRGRRVLAAVIALPLALTLAGAVLSGGLLNGGAAAASADSAVNVSFETVTVMPGDTLWGLATKVAPNADPRDVVDAIVRLNMLSAGALAIGQELAIPTSYSAK